MDSLEKVLNGLFEEFKDAEGKEKYSSEAEFNKDIIPRLVSSLGFTEDDLFFDVDREADQEDIRLEYLENQDTFTAEALLAESPLDKPEFLIKTKYFPSDVPAMVGRGSKRDWKQFIRTYHEVFDAKKSILVTNRVLILITLRKTRFFWLEDLEEDDVKDIYGALNSENLKNAIIDQEDGLLVNTELVDSRRGSLAGASYQFENFELDRLEFEEKLIEIEEALTNQEKKNSFEDLAEELFGGFEFLSVRKRNFRTPTSEVDLIVEYEGSDKKTIFDEYGRFSLVECKNWKSSVGADQVRDFKGKLKDNKIDLGILMARNGVSGGQGLNAIEVINRTFRNEDIAILVVDVSDLKRILEGTSFYQILDEKLFRLRFGDT